MTAKPLKRLALPDLASHGPDRKSEIENELVRGRIEVAIVVGRDITKQA